MFQQHRGLCTTVYHVDLQQGVMRFLLLKSVSGAETVQSKNRTCMVVSLLHRLPLSLSLLERLLVLQARTLTPRFFSPPLPLSRALEVAVLASWPDRVQLGSRHSSEDAACCMSSCCGCGILGRNWDNDVKVVMRTCSGPNGGPVSAPLPAACARYVTVALACQREPKLPKPVA